MKRYERKSHYTLDLIVAFCNPRTTNDLTEDKNKVTCMLCKKKLRGQKLMKRRPTKAQIAAWVLPEGTEEAVRNATVLGNKIFEEVRSG